MEIYQWIVPLISITYATRVIIQYRRKKRLYTSTIFWVLFWTALSALAFLPNEISVPVARILGIKSNVNAIIFVALGFMFSIVFYLSAVVEKLESQITELVRKIALDNDDQD